MSVAPHGPDLSELGDRRWDVIVDNSGYTEEVGGWEHDRRPGPTRARERELLEAWRARSG